jgi:adenylate kinase family enzyme
VLRQRTIDKASYILATLSPGEIQSYTSINVPKKMGRKYDSNIITIQRHVRGTNIPASTIKRMQNKTITPREPTIKKLAKMYERIMNTRLRAAGANKEDALKFKRYDPETISSQIRKYNQWSKKILHHYETHNQHKELHHIQWGMAHSSHDANEWDTYIVAQYTEKHG